MRENRWQQIEEVFNRAAVLPVAERQKFIEEVCQDDTELCREVLVLIESDGQENSFLNEPVFLLGAEILENDSLALLKQEQFADYRLKKLLGRGGMGAVFLAEDTRLQRLVAVKVLPFSVAEKAEAVSRFRQEARAASAVAHQNIAHIYEFSQTDGRYFLAMEYVRGRTLRELIKENLIDERRALDFALQIASALQSAHKSGIVHRDIKPENIIVTEDNLVKVLDFGLAKLTDVSEAFNKAESLDTIPGMIIGTTAYMSPEQVRGQHLDQRTDVWSLGVVLYEMLAKIRPFRGDTPSDLQAAILRDKILPLAADVKFSREFSALIKKSLQKDRLRRLQTASDFITEAKPLHNLLAQIEPQTNWQTRDWIFNALVPLMVVIGGFYGASEFTDYFSVRPTNQNVASPAVINKQIGSLVIPPFQNMTNDAEFNFLSEGLAEDLTRSLGSLNRMPVISYSSARKIKNSGDLQTVKTTLPVDSILRGRVERDGEHIYINLELIDLNSEITLWQQRFNAPTNDLLKLRNSLTIVVVNEFQNLTGGEKQLAANDYGTRNNAAFLKYLEGKYAPDRSTEKGVRRSIEPLKKAIELDPNYALAYVALADSYNLLGTWYGEKPGFYQPLAKKTIEKALAIDADLSEAHTTLAKIKMDYDRDFTGAEREFRRAIELNPNNALAHYWYGEVYLSAMGRLDESLRELETARRLNPLSSGILTALAWTYIGKKDYEQAINLCDAASSLNAADDGADSFKSMALMKLGRYDEAIAILQKTDESGEGGSELAVIYAASGQTEKAQKILHRLEQKSNTNQDVSPYNLAVIYAALGDRNRAFALLEKQAQSKSVDLLSMRIDPLLDSLRDDARFAALETKLGLPVFSK